MKNNNIKITKMTGAGNDFLILDLSNDNLNQDFRLAHPNTTLTELTKKWCHRHFGIGADGCLFLKKVSSSDVTWEFYNADGSSAEMCGNAARCVGAYCFSKKLTGKIFQLHTLSGRVQVEVTDQNFVCIGNQKLIENKPQQRISIDGTEIHYHFINSGVPHCVIELKANDNYMKFSEIASSLRKHPNFGEDGSNVTFYKPIDKNKIFSISYERGVEGFTLACGTGALAAAHAFSQKHLYDLNTTLKIQVPGGLLEAYQRDNSVFLCGPAQFIAEITPI